MPRIRHRILPATSEDLVYSSEATSKTYVANRRFDFCKTEHHIVVICLSVAHCSNNKAHFLYRSGSNIDIAPY